MQGFHIDGRGNPFRRCPPHGGFDIPIPFRVNREGYLGFILSQLIVWDRDEAPYTARIDLERMIPIFQDQSIKNWRK